MIKYFKNNGAESQISIWTYYPKFGMNRFGQLKNQTKVINILENSRYLPKLTGTKIWNRTNPDFEIWLWIMKIWKKLNLVIRSTCFVHLFESLNFPFITTLSHLAKFQLYSRKCHFRELMHIRKILYVWSKVRRHLRHFIFFTFRWHITGMNHFTLITLSLNFSNKSD